MNPRDLLLHACQREGHAFRPRPAASPYDLFVFGVRSASRLPDAWDDLIGCSYIDDGGEEHTEVWEATTDPGVPWLRGPGNPAGTAILAPGQHRGAFRPGLHQGKYPALRQAHALPVFRDHDRDGELDIPRDRRLAVPGWYGINIHAPWRDGLRTVGRASAGCQVFRAKADMARLLHLVDLQVEWGLGDRVSYTLFDEREHPELRALFDLLDGGEVGEAVV